MNRVFLYDGTWPGWLCAVAECLNAEGASASESAAPTVRRAAAAADLFADASAVATDEARARLVWKRLEKRRGLSCLRVLLEAWCSDVEGADTGAAALAVRLWRRGNAVLDDLADPDTVLVERAANRTQRAAHRQVGILRFAETADGYWYAPLACDCDVLFLIADHFAARFPTMRWIIHDRARSTAALHEPGRAWRPAFGFSVDRAALAFSERESALRAAWAGYFRAVAIEARQNPSLQANFLPHKHRADLPEFAPSPSARPGL